MSYDETTLTEILKEILEQEAKTQQVIVSLGKKLEAKDLLIEDLIKGHQQLILEFEDKVRSIQIKAPEPDLSELYTTLTKGLMRIHENINKGPKPIVRQLKFTLFPEQVRTPEYYHVMMRWLVWIILGSLFMILTYLLLSSKS